MSAKTRAYYAAKVAVALSAVAEQKAEPTSVQKKNLDKIFTYLPERGGRGPWVVVGRHDLDRFGIVHDILLMSSIEGKEDKIIEWRGENFLRFELKKEWATQVIFALQKQFTQRQDLEPKFR